MKNYKALVFSTLSFIALEGISNGEEIPVDIYVEGPHLTSRLNQFPNPGLLLQIGKPMDGNMFGVKGLDLDRSEKRLLKEGAKLVVVATPLNQSIIPPVKYAIISDPEHMLMPKLCGKTGDKIRAYNGAGKPLKSLTFMTKMNARTTDPKTYDGDCYVITEYEQ